MSLQGLQRYGLTENPYTPRELNPLQNDEDARRIARVGTFRILDRIDDYLQDRIDQQKPAFMLVAGRSHTGRSTVANYILSRYRDLRGIQPQRFIVPEKGVQDEDPHYTFIHWALYLHNKIDKARVQLTKGLEDDLKNTPNVNPAFIVPTFVRLMRHVSEELAAANPGAAFGVCLEDVPNYQIINTANGIFEDAETMCVFTAKDYPSTRENVIDPFWQNAEKPDQQLIELSPITGQEVAEIVRARWEGTQPHPFDPEGQGIVRAFQVPKPIKRVLHIVADMLDNKITDHRVGAPWPEAPELGYQTEDLISKAQFFERYWR